MTENQRVAVETMSKTGNNAAADMTEAVSFSIWAKSTVKPAIPDNFVLLQMDKTMQRIQERFLGVSQQLENKNILF